MRFSVFALLFLTTVFVAESRTATSFYEDDAKTKLLNEVEGLVKQAEDAVTKLTSQGKTAVAGTVKALEDRLKDLESQIKNIDPTSVLGGTLLTTLQTLVSTVEGQLKEQLKKVTGGSYYEDDVKTKLLNEVEGLVKQAEDAVTKLTSQGKTAVAGTVKALEDRLKDLETQIKNIDPTSVLGGTLLTTLQTLVSTVEGQLKEQLKKVTGGSYYADDVKDKLLKEIQGLVKTAQDTIAKLLKEGKTVVANTVKTLTDRLTDLESQIMKIDPTSILGGTLLTTLTTLVTTVETELMALLKTVTGGP